MAGDLLKTASDKIVLPVDHVVVREIKPGAAHEVVKTIGEGQIGVDIGPETVKLTPQISKRPKP